MPTFFRTVGTDYAQSTTDADFIRKGLGAKSVWIVDDGSDYSMPLADRVERLLRQNGVTVTRDSVAADADGLLAARLGGAARRAGRLPPLAAPARARRRC